MEIKGNTYHFTPAEKRLIKKLIDKKYGKVSTPVDYGTNINDTGLEADFYNLTGEMVSGSTLERFVGLTGNEKSGFRKKIVEIVIKYLDFNGITQFNKQLEYSLLHPISKTRFFDLNMVFKMHLINIKLENNKTLITRYLNVNKFEIVESYNSKLLIGDIIELNNLEVNEELVCNNVFRIINNKSTEMGRYKSGDNNKVSNISFSK